MISNIISRPELFWFFIGLVLFLAELIIPGFFIFFFGLGAWVTALLCLIVSPEEITNWQIIIFAVTSVITLIALRKVIQNKFFNKGTQSEDVEDEFTGKEAFATVGFGPGQSGKVEFKGTTWRAESNSDIKEGQKVVIIVKESFKLIVEPKN
jgi:membrane protein implicated in regulation of membrane protease activity